MSFSIQNFNDIVLLKKGLISSLVALETWKNDVLK